MPIPEGNPTDHQRPITCPEKPKSDVKSEANAINNAGVVVGMVDVPNRSPIGPNPENARHVRGPSLGAV